MPTTSVNAEVHHLEQLLSSAQTHVADLQRRLSEARKRCDAGEEGGGGETVGFGSVTALLRHYLIPDPEDSLPSPQQEQDPEPTPIRPRKRKVPGDSDGRRYMLRPRVTPATSSEARIILTPVTSSRARASLGGDTIMVAASSRPASNPLSKSKEMTKRGGAASRKKVKGSVPSKKTKLSVPSKKASPISPHPSNPPTTTIAPLNHPPLPTDPTSVRRIKTLTTNWGPKWMEKISPVWARRNFSADFIKALRPLSDTPGITADWMREALELNFLGEENMELCQLLGEEEFTALLAKRERQQHGGYRLARHHRYTRQDCLAAGRLWKDLEARKMLQVVVDLRTTVVKKE